MFGIDGVLLALILTFIILFAAILSGFPVAFAIGGAGVVSFVLVALLDSAGLLVHSLVDVSSPEYKELLKQGVARLDISKFSYPDLPRVTEPVFPGGWEKAVNRTLSFVVNRVNERVIAGQSIETLLAILMFVLMGITLEKSNIANDLLTSMARVSAACQAAWLSRLLWLAHSLPHRPASLARRLSRWDFSHCQQC